jgi:hypothetical protein
MNGRSWPKAVAGPPRRWLARMLTPMSGHAHRPFRMDLRANKGNCTRGDRLSCTAPLGALVTNSPGELFLRGIRLQVLGGVASARRAARPYRGVARVKGGKVCPLMEVRIFANRAPTHPRQSLRPSNRRCAFLANSVEKLETAPAAISCQP